MSFAYCFQSPNEGKVHTNYRMLKHCIHAHVRNGMLCVRFVDRTDIAIGAHSAKPVNAHAYFFCFVAEQNDVLQSRVVRSFLFSQSSDYVMFPYRL